MMKKPEPKEKTGAKKPTLNDLAGKTPFTATMSVGAPTGGAAPGVFGAPSGGFGGAPGGYVGGPAPGAFGGVSGMGYPGGYGAAPMGGLGKKDPFSSVNPW